VEDKPLNDWLVRQTLNLLRSAKATQPNKPLQLHTGLGDNDINLLRSNPAHLQELIAQHPEIDFVLLHSSYPYTREAGYLACVYPNVYLDLGEVFPMVSRDAQDSIIRESLELVPTTRLLWSTDGHFFPETYWLANKQFRDTLEKVYIPSISI
jgi:predicted TIM-barrel fold metal-dependent hydrolase